MGKKILAFVQVLSVTAKCWLSRSCWVRLPKLLKKFCPSPTGFWYYREFWIWLSGVLWHSFSEVKTELSQALKRTALEKGFAISDNQGEGNCMFFALSEQLERIKGIQMSHEELRRTIVQHLLENPRLVSTFGYCFSTVDLFAIYPKAVAFSRWNFFIVFKVKSNKVLFWRIRNTRPHVAYLNFLRLFT